LSVVYLYLYVFEANVFVGLVCAGEDFCVCGGEIAAKKINVALREFSVSTLLWFIGTKYVLYLVTS